MSFFSNAQESPALVFPELHVEMLAFNLQFSRLADVIHFPLKGPTLPHSFWCMEEKSAGFVQILWGAGYGWPRCGWQYVLGLSITGRLMLAVAVEWEVYARTHSATALGLVGLVIVVPVVTLSLPAGHLADRFSRKRIILVSQIFSVLTSLALALVSWKHLAIP